MNKSKESSSSEESVRNILSLLARTIGFGLNLMLLGHSLLFLLILVSGGIEVSGSRYWEFLVWLILEMTLALTNMVALAIPWKHRFFFTLRKGVVGVNLIAVIAYLYHLQNVRTGLSDMGKSIELIIFLSIVGTVILAFLLIKPSSIRNPLVCSKCGYDLRNVEHEVCPECGNEVCAKAKA